MFKRDENGNVLLTFALLAPVLIGAVAVAVDFSDAVAARTALQNAADSAALAGATALRDNSTNPTSLAEAEATQRAVRFASTNAPGASHSIKAAAAQRSVTVSLAMNKPGYFGKAIENNNFAISVSATAVFDQKVQACMLALGVDEPVGIGLVGAARIDAPSCLVQSNSTSSRSISLRGAPRIAAKKVCAAGRAGGGRISPPAENCSSSKDPFESRKLHGKNGPQKLLQVASVYTGSCDFIAVTIGASSKGTITLKPGIYCGGLTVQSADVRFEPGLYQMQDGPLALHGNASLVAEGASILLSGINAVLDMQGSPSMTISAMTSGPFTGVAIAGDNALTPIFDSRLQGSPTLSVNGSIYCPINVSSCRAIQP